VKVPIILRLKIDGETELTYRTSFRIPDKIMRKAYFLRVDIGSEPIYMANVVPCKNKRFAKESPEAK
jgi:hypothetical protein